MSDLSAQRMRQLREERGESQRELAKILGMGTKQQYAYIETGRELSFERLIKAAQHFGVTTDYLTGASDYKTLEEEFDACGMTDIITEMLENGVFGLNNKENDNSKAIRAAISIRDSAKQMLIASAMKDNSSYPDYLEPLAELCNIIAKVLSDGIVRADENRVIVESCSKEYANGGFLRAANAACAKLLSML